MLWDLEESTRSKHACRGTRVSAGVNTDPASAEEPEVSQAVDELTRTSLNLLHRERTKSFYFLVA